MDENLSGRVLKTIAGNMGLSLNLYMEKDVSWHVLKAMGGNVSVI